MVLEETQDEKVGRCAAHLCEGEERGGSVCVREKTGEGVRVGGSMHV